MPGGQGGPVQMPMPTPQAGPASSDLRYQAATSSAQILRDILGEAGGSFRAPQQQQRTGPSPQMKDLSDRSKQLGVKGSVAATVFGDRFEVGREVEQGHVENIQKAIGGGFDRDRR